MVDVLRVLMPKSGQVQRVESAGQGLAPMILQDVADQGAAVQAALCAVQGIACLVERLASDVECLLLHGGYLKAKTT